MIAFSFSDIGNRCENLDLLSTINCQNDVFGMVIMDGYSCSEWNMKILSGRLGKCVFSGDLNKDIIEPCKSVPVKAAVCFLFKNNTHLHIYNAGDCRVYNKSGVLLTEDNSVAWKRLKENGIDNKKIPHLVCYCPDRNYLTSFVDFCSDEIIFNHSVFDLNDENKEVILCTDGFWEHFNDGTVIDLMKDNPESNLAKFTKNIPGNAENHTVCYVRFPS
ncbi:TPA: protein phosphatase 2C family protein [Escherichia coli]|nr:protein phosphatase 2C family protein [Escherichia coli]